MKIGLFRRIDYRMSLGLQYLHEEYVSFADITICCSWLFISHHGARDAYP